MIQIPLSVLPSQEFSITLNEVRYDIQITATKNVMSCDIARDNTVIVSGQRCVPGFPIIPYQYLTDGNFIFITPDDEYPDYLQFGNTQFLIYADPTELEALLDG